MKTFFILFLMGLSTFTYAFSEDYDCEVRQYDVNITLTQDTSTSMWFRQNYDVLAMGYAGWVEKKDGKSIYHFYPGQFSPIEITFKTQDTIDLPVKLRGMIYISGPFFSLWDELHCTRRN
jgi:hypothetical protein